MTVGLRSPRPDEDVARGDHVQRLVELLRAELGRIVGGGASRRSASGECTGPACRGIPGGEVKLGPHVPTRHRWR
jgi:hypothetical protein